MNKSAFKPLLLLISFAMAFTFTRAQNPVNWTPKQLMQPADLAKAIESKKDVPVVISVGPGSTIPNSVVIGPVKDEGGLDKLKAALANVSKDAKVVVYCGCCPFEHCPNVRPTINALKELNFSNYYLLDLPHNIKTDWIDKGFPVAKQ